MPTGLQTFDGGGTLELDVTTRTGGLTGMAWTDSVHGNSIPVTKLDGDFIYVIVPPANWDLRLPQIRYDNGRMIWGADTRGDGVPQYQLVPCLVYYGWA